MEDVTIFVYYDWDKPHTVVRPEKPFTKEMELLEMLAKGQIVGFDITRIENIHGKRIRSVKAYLFDGDCNAVVYIPF